VARRCGPTDASGGRVVSPGVVGFADDAFSVEARALAMNKKLRHGPCSRVPAAPSDQGPTIRGNTAQDRKCRRQSLRHPARKTGREAVTGKREAEELLLIEEADAWFEYLEATRAQSASRYREVEPWAWARLSQRLRAIKARRAKLRPAAA
jgi:hypothetical protein